jgi:ribosomal protein L29
MKMEELKNVSEKDLLSKADELRVKIRDLRLQKFSGGEMNTALVGKTRKDLARVLTVASLMKKGLVEKADKKTAKTTKTAATKTTAKGAKK